MEDAVRTKLMNASLQTKSYSYYHARGASVSPQNRGVKVHFPKKLAVMWPPDPGDLAEDCYVGK